MAKILSIAATAVLSTTRQLILENAGHAVVSFACIPTIDQLTTAGNPDLAMVGHAFKASEKRKIALALNQAFPGIPILELCMHSPEIPGANFVLSHSPEHLLTAIQEVLSGHRVRGFPG